MRFILFVCCLLIFIIGRECFLSDDEDESQRSNVEKTLERALAIVRASKSPTSPRPTRYPPPHDAQARQLLDQLGESQQAGPSHAAEGDAMEVTPDDPTDPDYVPESIEIGTRTISLSTAQNVIRLYIQGRTEAGIRKLYSWYRRQYLPQLRKFVERGYRPSQRMTLINENVNDKFVEARRKKQPVRGFTLKNWALQEARKLNYPQFKASNHWLSNFKKRYEISSRKVTKITTKLGSSGADEGEVRRFNEKFSRWKREFPDHSIWNMDQTGFNYELGTDRTLSHTGERDTELIAGSKNKQTHSYTAQPLVSRAGKLIGKLLLCFQERDGRFGPKVGNKLYDLQQAYGNVVAFASQSGKMSSELNARWVRDVVGPAVCEHHGLPNDAARHPESLVGSEEEGMDDEDAACYGVRRRDGERLCDELGEPSEYCRVQNRMRVAAECTSVPNILMIVDAWAGNKAIHPDARMLGIKVVTLPEGSTADLQPLDVGFMRQYKLFVSRITNQAHYDELLSDVTSREGILNLQSLVWNQLSSPAYEQMLRWIWHNTDPDYPRTASGQVIKPPLVSQIQFKFNVTDCQVGSCTNHAFIRCSHCGKLLCLRHFLERRCFHKNTSVEDVENILAESRRDNDDETDEEDDEEEHVMGEHDE